MKDTPNASEIKTQRSHRSIWYIFWKSCAYLWAWLLHHKFWMISFIVSLFRCPLFLYLLVASTFILFSVSYFCLSICHFLIIRPHPQGQVVSLPVLPASKKDHQQEQTSIDPSERREELRSDLRTKATENWRAGEEDWRKDGRSEMGRGGGRGGWSWTVGESRCNAQWVRQKQEYRSTRPWWWHAVSWEDVRETK